MGTGRKGRRTGRSKDQLTRLKARKGGVGKARHDRRGWSNTNEQRRKMKEEEGR